MMLGVSLLNDSYYTIRKFNELNFSPLFLPLNRHKNSQLQLSVYFSVPLYPFLFFLFYNSSLNQDIIISIPHFQTNLRPSISFLSFSRCILNEYPFFRSHIWCLSILFFISLLTFLHYPIFYFPQTQTPNKRIPFRFLQNYP
jgi:hypothetical protein